MATTDTTDAENDALENGNYDYDEGKDEKEQKEWVGAVIDGFVINALSTGSNLIDEL